MAEAANRRMSKRDSSVTSYRLPLEQLLRGRHAVACPPRQLAGAGCPFCPCLSSITLGFAHSSQGEGEFLTSVQ